MKLETMKCPDCGSQLHFSDDQDFCFCSHCGTQVFKDEDNKLKIEKKTIIRNEADIIKAQNKIKELEYKERAEQLKIKKMKTVFILTSIVIVAVLALGAVVYIKFGGEILALYFFLVLIVWLCIDNTIN